MTTPLVGTDGSIDFWFVHLHGDHGFVSNGLRYSSLEEAQDFATGALKRNPAFCGAEIIPRVGERIKILAKDVS